MKLFNSSLVLLAVVFALYGCKEHDDPTPLNEEELITTVTLTLKKIEGTTASQPLSFSWIDEDGSGSGTPLIDEITIDAHATYIVNIALLDESKDPVVDIGSEIEEESTAHQFFFVPDGAQISTQYNDVDTNGKPLGLEITLNTEHESAGTLTVILKHHPNKDAQGVLDGDPANAGGDTDVQAMFPVTIIE